MKMNLRSLVILLGAACLLVCIGAAAASKPSVPARETASTTESAASGQWRAVSASGSVTARMTPTGSWVKIARGNDIPPRTLLRTGERGRVTLTRNGTILIVDPHSELELPASVTDASACSITQKSGKVIYDVQGRKARNFQVITPYLVAGVKGTVFAVSVSSSDASVSVDEGVVKVTASTSGQDMELHAGETAWLDADEPAMLQRSLSVSQGEEFASGQQGRMRSLAEARELVRHSSDKDLGSGATAQAGHHESSGEDAGHDRDADRVVHGIGDSESMDASDDDDSDRPAGVEDDESMEDHESIDELDDTLTDDELDPDPHVEDLPGSTEPPDDDGGTDTPPDDPDDPPGIGDDDPIPVPHLQDDDLLDLRDRNGGDHAP